jgi:hypothetical protein
MLKRAFILSAAVCLALAGLARAGQPLMVKPFVYDPGHTRIITAGWMNKIGLPDNGGSNFGLLLQKDGPTATNAAAGAEVVFQGVLTELGFDIRNDGHFGAGAPRFNVSDQNGQNHFMGGPANVVQTPGPAPGWTRVRINPYNPAQAFPPLLPGDTVTSIEIIFDEGTDAGGGPDFTGFAVLDNIDVNGVLVGKAGAAK